jgi:hypothetical protein
MMFWGKSCAKTSLMLKFQENPSGKKNAASIWTLIEQKTIALKADNMYAQV